MSQTVNWTATQWGTGNAGVWAANPQMGLDPTGVITGGAIFTATTGQALRFTTEASPRVLDLPIITLVSISADMNRGPGSPTPTIIEVGYVPDPRPEDYADALLPWTRGEVSLGTFTFTVQETPFFDRNTLTLDTDAVHDCRMQVLSRFNWSGRLALSFRASTGPVRLFQNGLPGGAEAQLTTSQDPFFAGLVGGGLGPRTRWVRDYRYGMPATNAQLVRDGDNPGLWVRPWDADPDDPPATYRPRPGEGTVDDEIGDL